MEKKQRTTKELIEAFKNGEFDQFDRATQIKAGWYDWFCKDTSLAAKTQKLYKKAIRLIELDAGRKIDVNNTYIWFKNNCPCVGKLYDDFRIADIKTGKVIFTVVPYSGYDRNRGAAELWGQQNNFQEALVEGTWADIKAFFKA